MVTLELRLPLVESSDSDLPLVRAGSRSAIRCPFRLDMANSRWLGVISIFATRHVRKWVWPEDARNARCVYTYVYRLAGHNVRAVLHWAAISVLGTEYGRWPTVIMHTGILSGRT